tara:strand:- start:132 stop:2570 length:2439 start_codon:yes stop_codon:yes gene_type:complete
MNDKNYQLALKEYREGNFLESEKLIDISIEENGVNSRDSNLLAIIKSKTGDIENAIKILNDTINNFPNDHNAYYNLAFIYNNQDKYNEAIKLLKKSIIINKDFLQAYYLITQILVHKKDLDEAIKYLEELKKIRPGEPLLYVKFSEIYSIRNETKKAIEYAEKAINLDPENMPGYAVLARANIMEGKVEDGINTYKKIINLTQDKKHFNNTRASIFTNLGSLYFDLEDLDEALKYTNNALEIDPNNLSLLNNLANIYYKKEEYDQALTLRFKILEAIKSKNDEYHEVNSYHKETYTLNFLRNIEDLSIQKKLNIKNIDETNLKKNNEYLKEILEENPFYSESIKTTLANYATNFFNHYQKELNSDFVSNQFLEILSKDKIINFHICNCVNTSIQYEKILIEIRSELLEAITRNESYIKENPHIESLITSIASQCYLNEYIWEIKTKDLENIRHLRESLTNSKENFESKLLALCMFSKLEEINIKDITIQSENLTKIKNSQILQKEKEIKAIEKIKVFGKIKNTVSQKVREQYEINPYPKWTRILQAKGENYGSFINMEIKESKVDISLGQGSKILIAGCGSGMHAIQVANKAALSDVTAIDISLTNLGYAKIKAEEHNIKNINFLHADILEMDSYKEDFDCIESVGVLHHMENPKLGFSTLSNKLKPGGIMKLGLYSKTYKSRLNNIKKYIDKNNINREIDQIHKLRSYIINSDSKECKDVINEVRDFYSTSEFVDLFLHESEKFYDLNEIQDWYRSEYNFLGFSNKNEIKNEYSEKYPEDIKMTDIENWIEFEKRNPLTFRSMYLFYLQKN